MTYPLVCIVLINWNGEEDTVECILSLQKIDYPNYKIVVIDNGSKKDSITYIKKRVKDIKVIESKVNQGYSGGNNLGINFAKSINAEYILFLNNDTIVSNNFLSLLVEALKNKSIGIVCPTIFYYDKPEVIWFAGGKIDYKKGPFLNIGQGLIANKLKASNIEVDYINGCCLLTKMNILEKTGGFNEKYFAYVEDIELNQKIKNEGYKVFLIPKAKIWHKVSSSSGGDTSYLKEYYKSRNAIFFAKEYVKNNKSNFYFYFLLNRFMEYIGWIKQKHFTKIVYSIKGILHGIFNYS